MSAAHRRQPSTAPRLGMVLVSNRLPLRAARSSDGTAELMPASGGLVTALAPLMRARGGAWIGWPGIEDGAEFADELVRAGRREGYRLVPVALTKEELDGFYHGFANEVIWPLFHDLQTLCNFEPAYWQAYGEINRRYARAAADCAAAGELIWVHDYQLMAVGEELRRLAVRCPLAFFLHIPFPSPDVFANLPWREAVLRSLAAYDLIGFQTARDRRNFADCVRSFLPEVKVSGGGQGLLRVRNGRHEARVGRFPISIDFNDFYRRSAEPAVKAQASELRRLLPDRQLVLGIDRLDYTKGIPERLRAFGHALERFPELHEKVTLIQVVVPSRGDIPRYQELKARIENLVGEINGRFTRPGGWVPIHYVFRDLAPEELLSYYRAAQVALVTPLKDGMNLVAKEYCACSPDGESVLILSEFAGAAAEMRGSALLVNPYDRDGVAEAIRTAVHMPPEERNARMRRLRRRIRRHDVYDWVDSFIGAVRGCHTPAAAGTGGASYQGMVAPR